MSRLTLILPLTAALCCAADSQQKKPPVDTAEMSSDVHAPLFQAPKSNDAGMRTAKLTEGLPAAAGPIAKVPRRNFIDEFIFGKMERDHIPSAPLSTDQEFFRRVTLDLTGQIPS